MSSSLSTLARLRREHARQLADDTPPGDYHNLKLTNGRETQTYACPCGYAGPKTYERHLYEDHTPVDFGLSPLWGEADD